MPILQTGLVRPSSSSYEIGQSIRFNDDDSAHLNKAFPSSGNRKTWTFSCWVKRAELSNGVQSIFSSDVGPQVGALEFPADDTLTFFDLTVSGSSYQTRLVTTAVFRDPSSFYNIVVQYDTTQSTEANRIKIYVNGSQITDFSTAIYPAQDFDGYINFGDNSRLHGVGKNMALNDYFDGLISEAHFSDGYSYSQATFGETNSATNQWVPKDTTGAITYGTNGFYLKGADVALANSFTDSGNGGRHSVTANGNVHTDTSVKKIGTASAQFDGTGDFLSLADSDDWSFGTGDFTLETWVRFNDSAGSENLFSQYQDGSNRWYLSADLTNNTLGFYDAGSGMDVEQTVVTWAADTWYHVAMVRSSGTVTYFVDGTAYTVTGTSPGGNITNNTGSLQIGRYSTGNDLNGYLDEIRISNSARYTSSFTPSTTAFASDSNTMLLLHCDGSDSGTSFPDSAQHTITPNGDVTNTRAQSKIGNSSIYFDGTGDYLSTASSGMGLTGDYTIECWFNTASSTSDNGIISNKYNNSSFNGNFSLRLNDGGNSNDIAFRPYNGTAAEGGLVTSGTGAWSDNTWTHVAVVRSGSGTGNVKMYIGGSLAGTSSGASSSTILGNAGDLNIGRQESASAGTNYLNGYMDEIRISNSARYTGTFTPSTTAFTADANTLLLIHSNWGGGLGGDSSGQGNDFTPSGLTANDKVLDAPGRNFATFNPLVRSSSNSNYSEGNLYATDNGSGNWEVRLGTIPLPETGKWYWECKVGNGNAYIGILDEGENITVTNPSGGVVWYGDDGRKRIDGTFSSYGASYGSANVLGVAVDMDASPRTITFYKDNTTQGSITITGDCATGTVIPYITSIVQTWINFGQDSSFANTKSGSASAQDANGKGDFFYTPVSNHLALCSDNLPNPSIADPTKHFNTVLYTGDGTTNHAITGVGFQPDLVWYKVRSTTGHNNLYDSVRGVQKVVYSDLTNAEATSTGTQDLYAFGADGFTVGSNFQTLCNTSGETFASWNWKAGGTAVSNTDGSVTSSVSANTDAGMSVVTWTNNSSTVGHGLSQAPELITVKSRTSVTSWATYVKPVGNGHALLLNRTDAQMSGGFWNSTTPTSSVFSVGADIGGATEDYIALCFHSVPNYSAIGSYTGNGNADGPMIYTGMSPAFVLVRKVSGDNWAIYDNARDPYNVMSKQLYPDSSSSEETSSARYIDFVSNGIKIRGTNSRTNTSGETYIYLAFAESPQKFSNAR